MYSRSYNDDERVLRIPEGYDGTALAEPPQEAPRISAPPPESHPREVKISPRDEDAEQTAAEPAVAEKKGVDSWRLPLFLRKIFPREELKLGIPSISGEELLIGAVALFLFFSDDGDKLCALMLLGLIFIT